MQLTRSDIRANGLFLFPAFGIRLKWLAAYFCVFKFIFLWTIKRETSFFYDFIELYWQQSKYGRCHRTRYWLLRPVVCQNNDFAVFIFRFCHSIRTEENYSEMSSKLNFIFISRFGRSSQVSITYTRKRFLNYYYSIGLWTKVPVLTHRKCLFDLFDSCPCWCFRNRGIKSDYDDRNHKFEFGASDIIQ